MEPNEAFKVGFLARCLEDGLSAEQTKELAKRAFDCSVEKQAGVGDAIKGLMAGASGLAGPVILGLAAAPPAIGGLSAYFYNKASDVDEAEVDDIKNRELVETYRRMADQLRRSKKLQNKKLLNKGRNQVFL